MTLPKEGQNVPLIDIIRCSGCGRCVAACPLRLITLETSGYRKHAVINNKYNCTACKACTAACPLGAIRRKNASNRTIPSSTVNLF